MFCENCGKEFAKDAAYCEKCGSSIVMARKSRSVLKKNDYHSVKAIFLSLIISGVLAGVFLIIAWVIIDALFFSVDNENFNAILWTVVAVFGGLTIAFPIVVKKSAIVSLTSRFLKTYLVLGIILVLVIMHLHDDTGKKDSPDFSQNISAQPERVLPIAEGEKNVVFDWKYNGKSYSLEMPLYDSYYQFYKSAPVSVPEKSDETLVEWYEEYNRMFISEYYGDFTVENLAQKLHDIGEKHKFDENQMVELISAFVQTIPYDQEKLDRRTIGLDGDAEKPTYPYEVLYENTGVCQDKSYLTYALLQELGYGVSIFLFPNPEDNHMAVGVKCPLEYSDYESGYCFLETTSLGNKIGMIPDLIPKSRIATSDVKIDVIGENQSEGEQYQPLGNVEIMNKIDGKEYGGIVATISMQREIEQSRRLVDAQKKELKELDEHIEKQEKELEKMNKKFKKMLKNDNFDDYKDTADDYDDLYSKYKKNIKKYNEKVKVSNNEVKRYNALNNEFYR